MQDVAPQLDFTLPDGLIYQIPFWIMTAMILLGLATLAGILLFGRSGTGGQRLIISMITEKSHEISDDNGVKLAQSISFSRVTGMIGALTLASLFVMCCYWAQYQLFSGQPLTNIYSVLPLFLIGSALFAPYAFNQLRKVRDGQTQQ